MANLQKEIEDLRRILSEKEAQFFHRKPIDNVHTETCMESNKYNKHLSNKEITRYSRQIFLLQSYRLQCRLKNKSVLLIGCGSMGCVCAMYLTSAGVGSITLVDGGEIKASCLPGQIFYKEDDVGKPIATCMYENLRR